MTYRTTQTLFSLTLLLLVSACSSNSIYRGLYEPCTFQASTDCAQNALQAHAPGSEDEYHLGFVEYDDQGQLRDRDQMDAVVDAYRGLAVNDDLLLIVFVHGWHHSAQPGDDNIASFRRLLREAARLETIGARQQSRKVRKVAGLYIGWRGDSISVPYLNGITFWERKNTAHDVGQQGVTEVLLKMEEIVNVKVGIGEESPPPMTSRLVVIGHSFGGAVVYTSLQKVLADRFIDSRRGKTFQDDAKGFGDLVVLLNPAFEALRFAALYDLSQQGCRGYFPSQLPRLAILTSEADLATKYAFPIGRSLSTLFESHTTLERHYCSGPGASGKVPMRIREGQADRNTVGHFEPYLTHRLDPAPPFQRKADFRLSQLQTLWSEHDNDEALNFPGSRLSSLKRTTALNPYLNIRVDEELIGGHNDIWGDAVIAFVRDLILISTTPAR